MIDRKSDSRLRHELEHLRAVIYIDSSKVIVKNPAELEEYDLVEVSDDPFFFQIFDEKGKILLQSKNISKFEPIPVKFYEFEEKYKYEDLSLNNYSLRVAHSKVWDISTNEPYIFQISLIDHVFADVVEKLIVVNLVTFPFVVIFIMILSTILVQKAFDPITKIINIAEKITVSNLSERITIPEEDEELIKLKQTLNTLFERLEGQIERIAQFTDNASHQLMTPLTAIQSELEFILKKERSKEEYVEALKLLKEQSLKMINIVKSMLILAKEEDLKKFNINIFNLSRVIKKEIIPLYGDHSNINYEIEDEIYCRGNAEFVSIIIYNLVDNALKYSDNDSPIFLSVKVEGNWIVITVRDKGMGISEEDKEKIFERFFRSSHSDKAGIKGYGLGLSLVSVLVNSLGGRIEIKSKLGKGSEFTVYLPAVIIE